MLDPDARSFLQRAAEANPPAIETLTPAEARAQFDLYVPMSQGPKEEVAEVRDFHVHGLLGPIPLRLYRSAAAPAENAACLVYFHGGGWVVGGLDTYDGLCRSIANLAQAVVISVDYRMGPEFPFPAAIEDGTAALRHILADAAKLGIDANRMAVGGDSAGGNIAAVMAIASRNGDAPPLTFQMLFYPVTDLSQTQESYTTYAEGYGLTTAGMAWFRQHYLGEEGHANDWRASPLRAHSLADVAPAFVLTAGFDVLHDEGRAYAHRLRDEGVVTTLDENPGQIHGFISMDGVIAEARRAVTRAVEAWRTADALSVSTRET
jgi:acetyl esterase